MYLQFHKTLFFSHGSAPGSRAKRLSGPLLFCLKKFWKQQKSLKGHEVSLKAPFAFVAVAKNLKEADSL